MVVTGPAKHATIDGAGWVCEPVDSEVFDPASAISWKPGYDAGDGTLGFGGWIWRYDLTPATPSSTSVMLSYDWSAVPDDIRERIGFPPFPPDHLGNSLAHLAELVA